jgi:tetratricopeptide (TPR) repeat protein
MDVEKEMAKAYYAVAKQLIESTVQFIKSRKYPQAAECLEAAITEEPNNDLAHYLLGYVYNTLNRHQDALLPHKKAIELNPNEADYFYGLGSTYLRLGQCDEALTAFQEATRLGPKVAIFHHDLGYAYKKLGQHEQAIFCFKKAFELDHEDAPTRYELGESCAKLSVQREMDISLLDLPEGIYFSHEFHLAAGATLGQLGNETRALSHLKTAFQLVDQDAGSEMYKGFFFDLSRFVKLATPDKSPADVFKEWSLAPW